MTKLKTQRELEQEMSDLGREKYLESVSDTSNDFETGHIQSIVKKIVLPFADEIKNTIDNELKQHTGGRLKNFVKFALSESIFTKKEGKKKVNIPLTPYQLSFITIRCLFSKLREEDVVEGRTKMTRFSAMVGRTINGNLKNKLNPKESITFGTALIRILVSKFPEWFEHTIDKVTGIAEPIMGHWDWDSEKEEYIIQPSELFISYCDEHIEHIAEISNVLYPMVEEPHEWNDKGRNGGFHSKELKRNIVKKTGKGHQSGINSDICEAINAVQSTPWRVNRKILEILLKLSESEPASLKKVFPAEIVEDLSKPFEDDIMKSKKSDLEDSVAEQVRVWEDKVKKYKTDCQARRSRILSREAAIKQAIMFKDYEKIYFPHDIDYRGRIYNICMTGLNTQGSDIQKGLLQFAVSRPVISEDGIRWMKINLANLATTKENDNDKQKLAKRIEWVNENEKLIRDVVNDPYSNDCWHEWDKPLQGLAAAIEYVKWLDDPTTPLNIHVQLDGLCNGVQHLAAITRADEVAEHVGLIETETRGDVYTHVLNVTKENLPECEHTNEWLKSGLLARKLTKTPVMTRSYGAKLFGIKEGVRDYIVGEKKTDSFSKYRISADWMGKQVWDSMDEALRIPMMFMDWVQECAGVLAKNNLPLKWESPIGMQCVQSPFKWETERTKVNILGKMMKPVVRVPTREINKPKAESSSSPNVIHSCDASHLMLTTLYCIRRGIYKFAMVHDSFGCHPEDAQVLLDCAKETWNVIYSEDIMDKWYTSWCEQLDKKRKRFDVKGKIPEPPKLGTLDPKEVINSDFFFA